MHQSHFFELAIQVWKKFCDHQLEVSFTTVELTFYIRFEMHLRIIFLFLRPESHVLHVNKFLTYF